MHSKLAMLLAGGMLAIPLVVQAEPFAYVTNAFAPSVSVIDTATNQIAATIAFPPGSIPIAAAITPDSRKVYVTSLDAFSTCGANAAVFVIDTASNTVGAGPIAVECEPTAIAVTPDGKFAYVASELSDAISVIDTATDAVSATISCRMEKELRMSQFHQMVSAFMRRRWRGTRYLKSIRAAIPCSTRRSTWGSTPQESPSARMAISST